MSNDSNPYGSTGGGYATTVQYGGQPATQQPPKHGGRGKAGLPTAQAQASSSRTPRPQALPPT